MASAGGIESQNVVGYQTVSSVAGFNFYAPMFRNVDGTKTRIQDIKLGAGVEAYANNLQILNEGGATVATYYYVTTENGFDMDGWVNDDDEFVDVVLEKGQSVIVQTSDADVSIIYAGEVDKEATVIKSVEGFNFVGNNVPRTINIQDIKLGEGVETYANNLQILNEGGATVATYYYVTAEDGFDTDGWVDDNDEFVDVKFASGQGVVVQTASADVEITLPSAF